MNCIFHVFIVANDVCAVLLPMIFHDLIKKRIQSNYRRVNGSHLNGFRLKREYFSLSFLSYFSFLWVFLFVIWGPAHSLKSVSNVCRVMKWYPPREMTSPNATRIGGNLIKPYPSAAQDGRRRSADTSQGVSALIAPAARRHYAAVLCGNMYKLCLICCNISAIRGESESEGETTDNVFILHSTPLLLKTAHISR